MLALMKSGKPTGSWHMFTTQTCQAGTYPSSSSWAKPTKFCLIQTNGERSTWVLTPEITVLRIRHRTLLLPIQMHAKPAANERHYDK